MIILYICSSTEFSLRVRQLSRCEADARACTLIQRAPAAAAACYYYYYYYCYLFVLQAKSETCRRFIFLICRQSGRGGVAHFRENKNVFFLGLRESSVQACRCVELSILIFFFSPFASCTPVVPFVAKISEILILIFFSFALCCAGVVFPLSTPLSCTAERAFEVLPFAALIQFSLVAGSSGVCTELIRSES
ncbi:hypothetical protein ABL78_1695 [Leptomonas seymouri]|uniref:Uncharacterized protein n=1 Tax=Leptomonas seymouri TaxID=5684 RepID=A0A0N1I8J2_LEPSE|nr:hypothetical protein ABL78_1695 [Leptomonas seymouri]|eukprot:KPI89202.1 hypothetical protein ABL78_1695 [Leptomonas seymouri]